MRHWKITKWCSTAVAKIHYPPDRNAVFEELRQHMDDRSNDFLEKGFDENEALEKTMEVMGDPYELAPMLGAIHRPYWGFAYSITKWMMRLITIITAICVLTAAYHFEDARRTYVTTLPCDQSENPNRTRILYLEPNFSATSDGYTFTVMRVAVQREFVEVSTGNNFTVSELFVELKVSNNHLWNYDNNAVGWFWIIDNRGNYYRSYHEGIYHELGHSNFAYGMFKRDPLAQYYSISIPYSEDLKWFELRYDRSGRDIVLHIDLTGGGSK